MRFFVDLQQPIVFPRTMKIYRSELTKTACKNMTFESSSIHVVFLRDKSYIRFYIPNNR